MLALGQNYRNHTTCTEKLTRWWRVYLGRACSSAEFVPYSGELTLPDGERTSGDIIAAAVCNGRQAGGGQPLAPHAYINDGLVDLVAFTSFAISDVPAVIEELKAIILIHHNNG